MSIHIGAQPGQIAPTVLMPGDPLRAKYFAETLLEDPVCFNEVRGMLGYTGTYQGKRVSVMGSGMVVWRGISSGPKRSIAQSSILSLEVATMSFTTLGRATILALGKAFLRTCNPKWWSGWKCDT